MTSSIKKPRYQKLDQIEHVLKRPDMYCGSSKLKKSEEYIAEEAKDNTYKIFRKEITFPPALLRIFVEVLSNAIDNVQRSEKSGTKCSKIRVNIDKESGLTSILNDGDVVPIEYDDEHKCYNHSMIFGQLLTGSNYNDEEERLVSGRNGLGGKLANVFSSFFKVQGVDPERNKILTQIWTNNMRETDGPKIKDSKLKNGYTEISWIPDFKQFNIKQYTDDIINLYIKYVIDASMLVGNVKVYFNDTLIPVKNLVSYSKLYRNPTNTDDSYINIVYKDSEVVLTPSDGTFETISFVNGVYTRLGGQHVDTWSESLFRPILDKLNKKDKPQVTIRDVKQFFRIFVVCTVNRPEFNGQEKDRLESPSIETEVKPSVITKIMKWSIINNLRDIIKGKEMVVLKKTERKKKGFVKVEGLDQANFAGTNKSTECVLILCEGLSAKTYAVCGLDEKGRNFYGILPLSGKCLNPRNSTPNIISKNKEITNLIQAIGLKYEVDYNKEENFNTLRYGKIMLLADGDNDGKHIEGLVINIFHSLFPTLLKRQEPFIISMKTPIVRIFGSKTESKKNKKDILFYDEQRFVSYVKEHPKVNMKYYKGLGTTKPEDVPDTFGKKMVEYICDEDTDRVMDDTFNKKYTDKRKDWMEKYDSENLKYSLDDFGEKTKISISDFINTELIKFSISDCKRSIPTIVDGFKESQRKIFYCVKKRNLKYSGKSLKVAQLGGYVAEHSNYHHGEQNLYETITKMAGDYIGSNNIPLLYRDGQFGSRIQLGKDSASPRYIYTKMDALTHLIFPDDDDILLDRVIDDGDEVEPKFYVPIIPMILVNGVTAGIGTGYSSNIPNYNPLDIVKYIKTWLDEETIIMDDENEYSSFVPWYRNFTGTITQQTATKYISTGILKKGSAKNSYEITELPIGTSTDKYKEFLEDLIENKQIKGMKNYSSQTHVKFVITELDGGIKPDIDNLKLSSYLHTSNMVLFNEHEQLKKYDKVEDIINEFCKVRLEYYIKRKKYLLKQLEDEIRFLGNKERFVKEVIEKTLNIMNVSEDIIVKHLQKRKYDDVNSDGFAYLLNMNVRVFTTDKINKLRNDIDGKETELKKLKTVKEKDIWITELDKFEKEYKKFIK